MAKTFHISGHEPTDMRIEDDEKRRAVAQDLIIEQIESPIWWL